MAKSDFWQDLATSFKASSRYDFSANRHSYLNSSTEPTWSLNSTSSVIAEFDALARRAASMLEPSPIGDLAIAWLEALWYEATHGAVRSASEVLDL
jgi:hypothetical protein